MPGIGQPARWPLRFLRSSRACTAAARDAATGVVLHGTAPVDRGLELDGAHRLADRFGALLQRRPLVRRELDLDHLLEAIPAQLAGHAEIEPAHPVLALQPRRTR